VSTGPLSSHTAADVHARRHPEACDVPPLPAVDLPWGEELEHLSPLEKLLIVGEHLTALKGAVDPASRVAANGLLLVASALTRLVHGDAGLDFAMVEQRLGESYLGLGLPAAAIPHLRRALAIIGTLGTGATGPTTPTVPMLQLSLGVCLIRTGASAKAVSILSKALALNQRACGEDDASNHGFLVALAAAHSAQSAFAAAEECLQSAWAVREHFLGRTRGFDAELARVHVERGRLILRKVALVEGALRRLQAGAEPGTDPQGPPAEQIQETGPAYIARQRRKAVAAFREAHDQYAAVSNPSPDHALAAANVAYQIGHLLWHLREMAAGYSWLEDAAAAYALHAGFNDPRTLHLMKDCVLLLLNRQPRVEPAPFTVSAASDFTDEPDPEPWTPSGPLSPLSSPGARSLRSPPAADRGQWDTLWASPRAPQEEHTARVSNLSTVRFGEMDATTGLERLKTLLLLEQRAFGRGSPQVSHTYSLMGDCYAATHNASRAAAMYERARAGYLACYGPSHDRTLRVTARLSELRMTPRRPRIASPSDV
jgi:tetratricopeptide (TPR) repeat protein